MTAQIITILSVHNIQSENIKKVRNIYIPDDIQELVTGLEPATCSLRMNCTTNCATQAYIIFYHKKSELSSRL